MNAEATGGGLAGAVVVIGVWVFQVRYPDIKIPPEVSAAITVVVSAAGAGMVALIKSIGTRAPATPPEPT